MKIPDRRDLFRLFTLVGGAVALGGSRADADSQQRLFIKSDAAQANAYSMAVVTQNAGKTIWLSGHGGAKDENGKSLADDFDAQVHEVFAEIGKTLERAGGKLSDIVTMTVFLADASFGRRFLDIRKEIFRDNFPASAVYYPIHVLGPPGILVSVQGVAVVA